MLNVPFLAFHCLDEDEEIILKQKRLKSKEVLSKCYNKVCWNGCARLLREKRVYGRPRTRVASALPYVPINVQIVQAKKL